MHSWSPLFNKQFNLLKERYMLLLDHASGTSYWILIYHYPSPINIMKDITSTWETFYSHGLTLIPAWKSNHTPSNVWGEISYPFPNFNGATVEVWDWMSNFIPQLTAHIIAYWSVLRLKVTHVNKKGTWWPITKTYPVTHQTVCWGLSHYRSWLTWHCSHCISKKLHPRKSLHALHCLNVLITGIQPRSLITCCHNLHRLNNKIK